MTSTSSPSPIESEKMSDCSPAFVLQSAPAHPNTHLHSEVLPSEDSSHAPYPEQTASLRALGHTSKVQSSPPKPALHAQVATLRAEVPFEALPCRLSTERTHEPRPEHETSIPSARETIPGHAGTVQCSPSHPGSHWHPTLYVSVPFVSRMDVTQLPCAAPPHGWLELMLGPVTSHSSPRKPERQ